jgi:ribosomal protein S18 acetylase RimI-like enzyme
MTCSNESMRPPANFTFRDMDSRDIAPCIWLRTQTRENRWSLEALTRAGITEESVTLRLKTTHHGWVCEDAGQIVGFSMCDRTTGEFWVVAVLPHFERRGIGTELVRRAQQWLHDHGWPEIWLWTSTDKTTRAYKLYQSLGWRDCGVKDGQLIMRHKHRTLLVKTVPNQEPQTSQNETFATIATPSTNPIPL